MRFTSSLYILGLYRFPAKFESACVEGLSVKPKTKIRIIIYSVTLLPICCYIASMGGGGTVTAAQSRLQKANNVQYSYFQTTLFLTEKPSSKLYKDVINKKFNHFSKIIGSVYMLSLPPYIS